MGFFKIVAGTAFDRTKDYYYLRSEEMDWLNGEMDENFMLYDWDSGIARNADYRAVDLSGKSRDGIGFNYRGKRFEATDFQIQRYLPEPSSASILREVDRLMSNYLLALGYRRKKRTVGQ